MFMKTAVLEKHLSVQFRLSSDETRSVIRQGRAVLGLKRWQRNSRQLQATCEEICRKKVVNNTLPSSISPAKTIELSWSSSPGSSHNTNQNTVGEHRWQQLSGSELGKPVASTPSVVDQAVNSPYEFSRHEGRDTNDKDCASVLTDPAEQTEKTCSESGTLTRSCDPSWNKKKNKKKTAQDGDNNDEEEGSDGSVASGILKQEGSTEPPKVIYLLRQFLTPISEERYRDDEILFHGPRVDIEEEERVLINVDEEQDKLVEEWGGEEGGGEEGQEGQVEVLPKDDTIIDEDCDVKSFGTEGQTSDQENFPRSSSVKEVISNNHAAVRNSFDSEIKDLRRTIAALQQSVKKMDPNYRVAKTDSNNRVGLTVGSHHSLSSRRSRTSLKSFGTRKSTFTSETLGSQVAVSSKQGRVNFLSKRTRQGKFASPPGLTESAQHVSEHTETNHDDSNADIQLLGVQALIEESKGKNGINAQPQILCDDFPRAVYDGIPQFVFIKDPPDFVVEAWDEDEGFAPAPPETPSVIVERISL